ncbi:MAG: hypothetical protein WBO10_05825 [Pyrinomonadaceae bacterium]
MKAFVVVSLIASLFILSIAPVAVAVAANAPANEAKTIEMVRSKIQKLGTGPKVKVEVKLQDGHKLKGYISEADDEQFLVVDKSGVAEVISYSVVRQVSSRKTIRAFLIAAAISSIPFIILAIENGRCKRGTGPCS